MVGQGASSSLLSAACFGHSRIMWMPVVSSGGELRLSGATASGRSRLLQMSRTRNRVPLGTGAPSSLATQAASHVSGGEVVGPTLRKSRAKLPLLSCLPQMFVVEKLPNGGGGLAASDVSSSSPEYRPEELA